MDPTLSALRDKIIEQLDTTDLLLARVPPEALAWRPPVPAGARPLWSTGELLPHLVESAAGFLAVLLRLRPEEMARVAKYRSTPLPDTVDGVRRRLAEYRTELESGFALLQPADLAAVIPTVFVAAGESALTLLLGNLEHLVNHKHQLFTYLRLLGVDLGTPALYRLRG
jgi:hypothetical protein